MITNGNMIRQDVVEGGESYYFQYVYIELNQLVEVKQNKLLIVSRHTRRHLLMNSSEEIEKARLESNIRFIIRIRR